MNTIVNMFTKIRANFLTGALIVIPLVVTLWVMYFIIDKLNEILLDPIASILNNWAPSHNIEFLTKALIFLLLLFSITVVGFAARILVLRNIFGFGERILYKVPMISTIYRTIKEMSSTLLAHKKSIFQRVVLIEYPRKGVYQLGFVTSKTKGEANKKTEQCLLNVFVPTAPNPTSGMLVLVPEEEAIPLDMSVADGMKMVISGGAVMPKNTNCHK